MVLEYFRVAIPVQEVRKKLGVTRSGTDIHQLRQFFQDCGFRVSMFSHGYPKMLRDAIKRKAAVICGMDMGGRKDGDHWAVVYGYRDSDFLVADPATSRSLLSAHSGDKFRERWDKSGLVISNPVNPIKTRIK